MRDTVNAALCRLFSSSDGQSVVEYGLFLSLIVLVIVTAVTASQGQLGTILSTAASAVPR
jgi:Flp pilus assembly pilin Flp